MINKAAGIERAVARAREEYQLDPTSFSTNYSRQDAAILNIQRACKAALDMGQHLIRQQKLGVPQSSRNVFKLLARADLIEQQLAESLKRMAAFTYIAVRDNQKSQLSMLINTIAQH